MTTPREFLAHHHLAPHKGLSQNFLQDRKVIDRFVNLLDLSVPLFEIGPGTGSLTRSVQNRGGKIKALELDRELAEALQDEFNVIQGDALEFDFNTLEDQTTVFSNLPFHITAPILSRLVSHSKVKEIHVIVQEEMARRICAQPGTKEMSLLTLTLQNFAEAVYQFKIAPSAFYPPPKVTCAALSLYPKKPLVPLEESEQFFAFLHAPFRQRRKMLRSTLKGNEEAAEKAGIDLTLRPEMLSLQQWYALYLHCS
jgi:16S rRNA (adenine1518-N6/adenine1519-N6)-dimethyltransferase